MPVAAEPNDARPSIWLILLVLLAALASAGLLLWALGDPLFSAVFLSGLIGLGAVLLLVGRSAPQSGTSEAAPPTDLWLLRAALDTNAGAAVAITGAGGDLLAANQAYSDWFGPVAPTAQVDGEGERMRAAVVAALRDGHAVIDALLLGGLQLKAELVRAGFGDTHVLWRFSRADDFDLAREARRLLVGEAGQRIGEAGMMVALADGDGNLVGANRAFAIRATGKADAPLAGTPLTNLVEATEDGQFHFAREARSAGPLRIVQIPVADQPNLLTMFLLLDDPSAVGRMDRDGAASLNTMVETLPLGLALANVDGRFVHLNKEFRQAAGLGRDGRPVYPGDLVVDEDKATVSDAVRRHARGPAGVTDMTVRLKAQPDETVALRIAGVRGIGDAAVLLAIKDNKEADRLKRQVAQATKMQAVGQLAGGVAHDFNNILTAILGYCDLMLMRHTPGDSDYDDIQQIRSNSNRAAGLTRSCSPFRVSRLCARRSFSSPTSSPRSRRC
jgi:two-component system cell cycle sensor histidine kinase/response regulator CckA